MPSKPTGDRVAESSSHPIPLSRLYTGMAPSSSALKAEQDGHEEVHVQDTTEHHGLLSRSDPNDSDDAISSKDKHSSILRARQARRRGRHKDSEPTFLQDRHRWLFAHPFYHPARLVLLLTVVAFVLTILIFSARSLVHTVSSHAPGSDHPSHSSHYASSLDGTARIWNGTHDWRRTVILISLDGTKPAYLDQGLAPNLQELGTAQDPKHKFGARRARAMQPIFPTLTFPNHWALLTGLYAESHGIVANDFHAVKPPSSSAGRSFLYTDPARSWDPSWWRGVPIWASAERSGIDTAVLMWPGPPRTSAGDRAKYFEKYQEGPRWDLSGRLQQITTWLDLPFQVRPQLICAYAPDIDKAAHRFGPDSDEAHDAVRAVDAFIGNLTAQLASRNLHGIVDVIVVSDHGMTATSNERLVFLDDVLGPELYGAIVDRDGWPSAGLRFRTAEHLDAAEKRLRDAAARRGGFDVYRRDRGEMPARWHYAADSARIAELWAVPHLGWSVTHRAEFEAMGRNYVPRGNHGYDNEEPDMAATFVARGPSFRPLNDTTATNTKWNMDQFANVQVYNLVAQILGVPHDRRAPNNGTIGFWDAHLVSHLL